MTKENKFAQLCLWSFGFIFCFFVPNYLSQPVTSLAQLTSSSQSKSAIIAELKSANIIYLGEIHTSLKDHLAQLEIIELLASKNSQIVIALEMFQRPYQSIVNQYLAGKISEAQLKEQTEYEQRWGREWEDYAPIIRLAKAREFPLLALNTPTEISRKVARLGLESLTQNERRWIPPTEEICLNNQAYRQMVSQVYQQHVDRGDSKSRSFENFFTAQVLWDETMAETISQFYLFHPNHQIIVLAGRTHIIYGYGIPSRVARRLKGIPLVQRSILMGDELDREIPLKPIPADYFWKEGDFKSHSLKTRTSSLLPK